MKRWFALIGAWVASLVIVGLAGRYSAPVKIEERIKVETKTETKIEWRDRVVEKRVAGPVRIVEKIIREADGDIITERTIDRGPVVTNRASESEGAKAAQMVQVAESVKIVESDRPGWRLSLGGGWDPRHMGLEPATYDLRVERRLFGTLWLGAFGRTDKTAGITIGLEW